MHEVRAGNTNVDSKFAVLQQQIVSVQTKLEQVESKMVTQIQFEELQVQVESVQTRVAKFFFCLSNAYCARAVSQQRVKLLEPRCVYSTQGPGGKGGKGQRRERAGPGGEGRKGPAKGGKARPKSRRREKGEEVQVCIC